MRRYWLAATDVHEGVALIEGDSFHHIIDVCRLQRGDRFEILIGDGQARLCELTEVERSHHRAQAKIMELRPIESLSRPLLHLLVSVPRFATFETILEKAVELGVSRVTPFFSQQSFVRTREKISAGKWDRWRKIIVSATQQTGRGFLMELGPALTLKESLSQLQQTPNAKGLLPYEGECVRTVKQGLAELAKAPPDELWLFVGSEGGFAHEEIELFGRSAIEPVSFGSQILRVETACLALLSVIKYEFDL